MTTRDYVAEILYGSYIRYDRMYGMTQFAFAGTNLPKEVNVYIDVYSILKSLYKRGLNFNITDSYVIASCMINLAIHIRAYFLSRHQSHAKVHIIYGGTRLQKTCINYNIKNIIEEDSNYVLKSMIDDNLNIMSILCPYLYDIFCIVDWNQEFITLASSIIDCYSDNSVNIIYSRDPMSYQLVAFEPYTFLYRPKKTKTEDISFVVTKSTLYNAYRYGELGIETKYDTNINVQLFSLYLAIAGVQSRNLRSIRNGQVSIKILEKSITDMIILNGYNSSLANTPELFKSIFNNAKISPKLDYYEIFSRYITIDLPLQKSIYNQTPQCIEMLNSVHQNLYDPQTVRNINDRYFQRYPLDLNRV